ncbi:response regulator transcription factor [bacterium]|nr:response regulator transcription factor [bacterium]
MQIEVAIIEDDDGVRTCLQSFINRSPDCCCRLAAASGEEGVPRLTNQLPDVLLLDIGLPGMDGIQVIRHLKALNSPIKIIMLTVYKDDDKIFSALKAGADGYLLKRSTSAEILQAIQEVSNNGAPMTGIIARKVITHFRHDRKRTDCKLDLLSNRESEILELLAKGDLYKEIAAKLSISYETVHTHIRRIYEKLHVHSRTQAVSKYLGGDREE